MAQPVTMRSGRAVALMAFGAVFLTYVFVLVLVTTLTGNLPDQGVGRLIGVVAVLALSLSLAVVCALSTRRRVIVTADGIEVVRAFGRERLSWDEIAGMSMHARSRSWDVNVRTAKGEQRVLFVPIFLLHNAETKRYEAAPPFAPARLHRQYGVLRNAWKAHRTKV